MTSGASCKEVKTASKRGFLNDHFYHLVDVIKPANQAKL